MSSGDSSRPAIFNCLRLDLPLPLCLTALLSRSMSGCCFLVSCDPCSGAALEMNLLERSCIVGRMGNRRAERLK